MTSRITGTPQSPVAPSRTTEPRAPSSQPTPTTQTPTPGPSWAPKTNDKVLFVAMNNSAAHRSTAEADALSGRGTNITLVKDAPKDDTIATTSGGRTTTHDLSKPEGSLAFAMTLGLPGDQTKKIAAVLDEAGSDARDELAQIAQQWATAERGGQIPSRLVLSGHHVGSGVYGENNGKLAWPLIAGLAEAMPRAARAVEDLLVAGCYSGGESMMEQYTAMFPGIKTVVAYDGSSPGAASGAVQHQRIWELATRGDRESINRNQFQNMRKGENVTVWTKTAGFDDGKPKATVEELKSRRDMLADGFKSAWDGSVAITDPQSGPVRDYYNSVQRLIQHPNTTRAERTELEAQRDQTIRLLFLGPVSQRFQATYGSTIDAGYRALGLPSPDFKSMTRAQTLASIRSFEEKLAQAPDTAAAKKLAPILRDYAELRPSLIPDTWV